MSGTPIFSMNTLAQQSANQTLTYPDNLDFSTFWRSDGVPDLDPSWTPIPGARAVMERIARRWITEPGEMDDPTIGGSLFRIVNSVSPGSTSQLAALQARLRSQGIRVEGVDDLTVAVAKDVSGVLIIQGSVKLAQSQTWTFAFVLDTQHIALITLLGS